MALADWRQFDEVDIDLSRRLTVLTGANGAGKTTLLNILSQSMGWGRQFVSEPKLTDRGELSWFSGLRRRLHRKPEPTPSEPQHTIGTLVYRGGVRAPLTVPASGGPTFNVSIQRQQLVAGVVVPSHRILGNYQPVSTIPTTVTNAIHFLDVYENELRQREAGGHTPQSPTFRIKESLIALATFGYGNAVVTPVAEYAETFEGFQRILRSVLPRSLAFEKLLVTPSEVIIQTRASSFSLDAVSGGVSALFDLAWRIFLRARVDPTLVVVIDEPENHLHPELQRELLPGLLRAFPQAQFVAATHSPFIIGAVADSNVYVLRYTGAGDVESVLLDRLNKAGSSNEILRDALGVEFTMPVWVQDELESILQRYESVPVTENSFRALRNEMADLGLAHLFPDVSRSLEQNDQTGSR